MNILPTFSTKFHVRCTIFSLDEKAAYYYCKLLQIDITNVLAIVAIMNTVAFKPVMHNFTTQSFKNFDLVIVRKRSKEGLFTKKVLIVLRGW